MKSFCLIVALFSLLVLVTGSRIPFPEAVEAVPASYVEDSLDSYLHAMEKHHNETLFHLLIGFQDFFQYTRTDLFSVMDRTSENLDDVTMFSDQGHFLAVGVIVRMGLPSLVREHKQIAARLQVVIDWMDKRKIDGKPAHVLLGVAEHQARRAMYAFKDTMMPVAGVVKEITPTIMGGEAVTREATDELIKVMGDSVRQHREDVWPMIESAKKNLEDATLKFSPWSLTA